MSAEKEESKQTTVVKKKGMMRTYTKLRGEKSISERESPTVGAKILNMYPGLGSS